MYTELLHLGHLYNALFLADSRQEDLKDCMILGEVHLMSVCQINDLLKKFRDNRFTAGVDRVVPITTDDSTYRKKLFFSLLSVVVGLAH